MVDVQRTLISLFLSMQAFSVSYQQSSIHLPFWQGTSFYQIEEVMPPPPFAGQFVRSCTFSK